MHVYVSGTTIWRGRHLSTDHKKLDLTHIGNISYEISDDISPTDITAGGVTEAGSLKRRPITARVPVESRDGHSPHLLPRGGSRMSAGSHPYEQRITRLTAELAPNHMASVQPAAGATES